MKEDDIRSCEALNHYLELVRDDCKLYFNDKSSFSKINCPACDSSSCVSQFEKSSFEYVVCSKCSTLYARTRPSLESIKQFYAQSASSTYWVNHFFKPFIKARREKIFRPRAEYLTQCLGANHQWLIGDIGAGYGLFLEELGVQWPESRCVAIEPSYEQAEICTKAGIPVECCFIEELEGYDGRFDLLTAFELFEHLYDPIRFIDVVHRLLKPGGWFFMTTLNGQGFDIQVLGENSKSVTPPHHLNFLNPKSLSALFRRKGFDLEEVATPGKLDWSIVEGMITKENVDVCRFWKMFSEQGTQEAKSELQHWLSKHGLSSHMRLLARKQT